MIRTLPKTMLRTSRACDREFGKDHPHDDFECAQTLGLMQGDSHYDPSWDYPSYDPQGDHFERFGRPAFPNEY